MDKIQVKRAAGAKVSIEYGCEFRRLLPWHDPGPSDEGMALALVPPGGTTAPHDHAEFEHFVVLEGRAIIWVDGHATECGVGDAVRVAPGANHAIENASQSEPLRFLSLWSLETFARAE